jgi:tetratricopeptide (TPR) repeat protein
LLEFINSTSVNYILINMKTIDFSHFIERYIAGEMGEDERNWFEKELEGNANLRNEVDLRKKTEMILKNQSVLSLRNKLTQIEKQRQETETTPVKRKSPVYIRYAAGITAVVVIGSAVLFTGNHVTGDEVINKYYKAYEPPASQRSFQSSENADFSLALEFYNTNDFANAALFFSKVVESNPKDMQSVLMKGVSNFEDKQYPEAKQSFTTVINDNNNLFIETAKWYLALCYIKTNDTVKAISQLQGISEEGGIYSKNARMILRKLK